MADEVNLRELQAMLDYVGELARGLALELHHANPGAAGAYAEKVAEYARNPKTAAIGQHANYIVAILREGKKPAD